MSNSSIKTEFKGFIRELTTEICREVLIEDIIALNHEYNKNNQTFASNTRLLNEMLEESQKNIKELCRSYNLAFDDIAKDAKKLLKDHQNDLTQVLIKNSEEIESSIVVLKEAVENIKGEEGRIKEKSDLLNNLTVNIVKSNENVYNAMNSLEKQNITFIEKILEENKKLSTEYMIEVSEFNDMEREKFSKALEGSTEKYLDDINQNINKNMTSYTKTIVNNVRNEIEKYSKALDKIVNGEKTQGKLNTITQYIKNIEKKQIELEGLQKDINIKVCKVEKNIDGNFKKTIEDMEKGFNHLEGVTLKELTTLLHKIDELDYKVEEVKTEYKNQTKKNNMINIGLCIIIIIMMILIK